MNTALTTRPDLIPTKRHRLRNALLKIGTVLAVLGPTAFILGAIGTKLGLWSWKFGLGLMTMKIGPLVLLLALITGVAALIMAFWVKPRKGVVVAALIALVPAAGLLKLTTVKSKVSQLPFIHDVTTDTQNPPEFTTAIVEARGADGKTNPLNYVGKTDPKGTLVSVLQTRAYPDIRPLVLSEAPDVVFGEVLAYAKGQSWKIETEDSNAGIIEATDTTFWYGFKDDVIIRIRPSEGGGTLVDMRSISRVGGSDIGKNAERIRGLMSALK